MIPLSETQPNWEIWLQRYNGESLIPLTPLAVDAHLFKGLNALGAFSLTLSLPDLQDLGYNDIPTDSIIEFRRKFGVVKTFSFYKRKSVRDKNTLTISGYGLNHLLARRHIAYYAGTTYTQKTGTIDDVMKAFVRENCTSAAVNRDTGAAVTARDYAQIISFSVRADLSAASNLSIGATGTNLFELLQRLGELSKEQDTWLFFEVVRTGTSTFVFETFYDTYGIDRRGQLTFGEDFGNMENVSLTLDHSEEENYIYVYGQGDSTVRKIVEVENTTREGASPLNRMEGFLDARNTAYADLPAKGYRELDSRKPLKTFGGKLLNTENAYYGLDWDLGDKLDVTASGEQFDAMVSGVEVSLSAGGETITGKLVVLDA